MIGAGNEAKNETENEAGNEVKNETESEAGNEVKNETENEAEQREAPDDARVYLLSREKQC